MFVYHTLCFDQINPIQLLLFYVLAADIPLDPSPVGKEEPRHQDSSGSEIPDMSCPADSYLNNVSQWHLMAVGKLSCGIAA